MFKLDRSAVCNWFDRNLSLCFDVMLSQNSELSCSAQRHLKYFSIMASQFSTLQIKVYVFMYTSNTNRKAVFSQTSLDSLDSSDYVG